MYLSVDNGDSGWDIYLNGVEQAYVFAADDVAGWVDVHDTHPGGIIPKLGAVWGDTAKKRLFGKVECVRCGESRGADFMDAVREVCR